MVVVVLGFNLGLMVVLSLVDGGGVQWWLYMLRGDSKIII